MAFGLFLYLVIILSAVFHEFMHGWAAYQLGDTTAKDQGRLTLNPLKHIDTFGTVILPLFLLMTGGIFIGYAKPVPYNPYNLSDQKFGSTKVAFAGPAANFVIAILFGLLLRFIPVSPELFVTLSWVVYINLILGFFNLIPVPPLDGSKLLIDLFPKAYYSISKLSIVGILIALLIAFVILSPIARFFYDIIVGQAFVALALF
ncbi:MAG: site-2 protease family protein [Parcubacteria group bacterium]